ncbi:MAG: LysM peptidoglycan-binding domain-containing protein [Planctomycetota bacterium]
MTLEQKLALLIGFGLSLAMGMLISDHVSRGAAASLPSEAAIVPDPTSSPPQIAWVGSAETRVGLAETVTATRGERLDPSREEPNDASLPVNERAATDRAQRDARRAISYERAREMKPDTTRPAIAIYTRPNRAGGRGRPTQTTEMAETLGKVETHHVVAGESLFSIARDRYGNGHLWPELARLNEGRVGDDGSVRIGVRLKLPPGDVLAAHAAVAKAAPETNAETTREALSERASNEPARPRRARAIAAYASYTVQRNDTLSELAMKLMGTVRKTDRLIELNKDVIRNRNVIRPGMVLRYPVGPEA